MARLGVAREGKTLLLATLAAALAVYLLGGGWWVLPPLAVALLLLVMFRDPERNVPAVPLAIISPVDGRVVAVERVTDPYLQRDAQRITLRRNLFAILTMRSPTEGKMQQQWGTRSGEVQGSAGRGQRYAMWIQTDEQDDVVLVQHVPALRMARPHCYIHVGERIGQGERCGIAPLGRVVEVYLPENSRIEVEPGSRVAAGSDIIATLMRHD